MFDDFVSNASKRGQIVERARESQAKISSAWPKMHQVANILRDIQNNEPSENFENALSIANRNRNSNMPQDERF